MDTVALVEDQIEDGRKLLDQLDEQGFIVRAAFWVKPTEEERWSLYIATPAVDAVGAAAAYRQVFRALRSLESTWISDSDITLVGEKHPVAREALEVRRRLPARILTRSRSLLLGGMPVEEVVFYPTEKGTPAEVTIYGLVFRGEPNGALHLSLEPHNSHSTLAVESQGVRHEYPAQTGIDWLVAAPEGAALERDEIGRMMLAWDWRGKRMHSSANEVWSLAKLGLHGFHFLSGPPVVGESSSRKGAEAPPGSRAESHASE